MYVSGTQSAITLVGEEITSGHLGVVKINQHAAVARQLTISELARIHRAVIQINHRNSVDKIFECGSYN